MSNVKTIVLELLRDGPSHNQLLSPLTVYLAACQNRPPEALRLNVEHHEFLRWQGGLTYADGGVPASGRRLRPAPDERRRANQRSSRADAIDDATDAVTDVLGSIRALIAELASEPCEWRHIHLVIDAAELGALPFELARAAAGLMVEGERLFLQQNLRVTLTRQTRRVATSVVEWPSTPRVLCVVADGALPLDAHVLALRQAIDPWIGWNDGEGTESGGQVSLDDTYLQTLLGNRSKEAETMLTVLVNPTLDDVSRETRRATYTHVHLLSHGAPLEDVGPGQTLYGLCFRHAQGGIDVVDGDRLEAALRHTRDCCHPTVVTLATCEGASVSGAILGPGGSVAHALHAKGIPLVIAAQFPLTKGASAIFADMLYSGLLRGEDPRQVVHGIRRELLVAYPDTHDWASLVVYGSFPPNLEHQLGLVRRSAEKLAIQTAAERLRVTLRRHLWLKDVAAEDVNGPGVPAAPDATDTDTDTDTVDPAQQAAHQPSDDLLARQADIVTRLEKDADRLDRAARTIQSWTADANDPALRVKGHLLLAKVALRVWDMTSTLPGTESGSEGQSIARLLGRKPRHDDTTGRRQISALSPNELLEGAEEAYTSAYALDGSRLDVWVQVAFLRWLLLHRRRSAGLGSTGTGDETGLQAELRTELAAMRTMAARHRQLGEKAGGRDRDTRSLHAAMEFEIALLSECLAASDQRDEKAANDAFRAFVAAAAPVSTSYRAHAVWRQLQRYERSQADCAPRSQGFRDQLQRLGVRRYWGPRS